MHDADSLRRPRLPVIGRLGPLIIVGAIGLSPTGRQASTPAGSDASHRTYLPGHWTTRFRIGAERPYRLAQPGLVAASRSHVYVYDYGSRTLLAVGLHDGRLDWTAGGRGKIRFANPTDLKVDRRGLVWVLDPFQTKLLVFGPAGQLEREFGVPRTMFRLAVLADGSFWGIDGTSPRALRYRFAPDGTPQTPFDTAPFTTATDKLPPLTREVSVAVTPAGTAAAAAFLWSDRFLIWRSPDARQVRYRGIEREEFPGAVGWDAANGPVQRVAPSAHKASLYATATDTTLLLLYAGATPYAGRIVDAYQFRDGRYAGSFLLPAPVVSIAATPSGVVAVSSEPAPQVSVLDWVPAPR